MRREYMNSDVIFGVRLSVKLYHWLSDLKVIWAVWRDGLMIKQVKWGQEKKLASLRTWMQRLSGTRLVIIQSVKKSGTGVDFFLNAVLVRRVFFCHFFFLDNWKLSLSFCLIVHVFFLLVIYTLIQSCYKILLLSLSFLLFKIFLNPL